MSEIITMVHCPYCGEEWIRDEDELVCERCETAFKVDLAVTSILSSLRDLSGLPTPEVRARLDLLTSAHHKLTDLLKKIDPQPRKG